MRLIDADSVILQLEQTKGAINGDTMPPTTKRIYIRVLNSFIQSLKEEYRGKHFEIPNMRHREDAIPHPGNIYGIASPRYNWGYNDAIAKMMGGLEWEFDNNGTPIIKGYEE